MKLLILIAAAGLVLTLSAWFLVFKPSPQPGASMQSQPTPTPDASAAFYAEIKALLFTDQSLEEVLKYIESSHEALRLAPPVNNPSLKGALEHLKNSPPVDAANNPFSLWASSLAASQKGQREEAKKYLKQCWPYLIPNRGSGFGRGKLCVIWENVLPRKSLPRFRVLYANCTMRPE